MEEGATIVRVGRALFGAPTLTEVTAADRQPRLAALRDDGSDIGVATAGRIGGPASPRLTGLSREADAHGFDVASGDGLPGTPGRRRARLRRRVRVLRRLRRPGEEPQPARRAATRAPTSATGAPAATPAPSAPVPPRPTTPPTTAPTTARPPSRSPRAAPAPMRAAPREEPSGISAPRPSVVRTIGPTTAARVHVVEPQGFNDAQEVGDRLKANQPVILNLQGLPRELQRRLIDFSSGLAYAVAGNDAARRQPGLPAHPEQRRGLPGGEGPAPGAGSVPALTATANRSRSDPP